MRRNDKEIPETSTKTEMNLEIWKPAAKKETRTDTQKIPDYDRGTDEDQLGIGESKRYVPFSDSPKPDYPETWDSISLENKLKESLLPFNDIEAMTSLVDRSHEIPLRHRTDQNLEEPPRLNKCKNMEVPNGSNTNEPIQQKTEIQAAINELLAMHSNLYQSKIRFEISPEAAQTNWELLEKNNFSLEMICNGNKNRRSISTYGLEFKHPKDLKNFLDGTRNGRNSRESSRKELILISKEWTIDLDEQTSNKHTNIVITSQHPKIWIFNQWH